MSAAKNDKKVALETVFNILCDFDPSANGCPAGQIVAHGTAMVAIGQALEGLPLEAARRVVMSAAVLHGLEVGTFK